VRVAVTGIASDFGTVIAPLLFADDEVEEIVGVDLRDPRVTHTKLTFAREDVRSPRMRELFDRCEAVIHLAYVVQEIHDKELTHSINLGGSKNVIACASEAGVKRLVLASSIASYGVHGDHPVPLTEEEFPRGNPDKYYFYDKAEVEHYVEWWERRHPDAGMVITRIRPPFIVGPSFLNPAIDRFCQPATVVPADAGAGVQLLWEDDLARAFYFAAKEDAPGPFNVGTEDWTTLPDLAEIHGQRLAQVPVKVAAPLTEALFRLRLSPVSSDWVISGEAVVSIDHAREALGWEPRFSSAESARMLLVQRGRPILPGRSNGVFARKEAAEKTLEQTTARLRTWSRSIEGLRAALDGPGSIDAIVERVEHVLVPYRDTLVHLEVQEAADPSAPTVVFSPGIGAYSRFYLPLLGGLCDAGMNVVGIDRPGHGLSEGRRGDCTMEEALDVVEEAIRYARERFGGPVVLAGSSFGGIISWYALTREPDVEAVVCHNIAHPHVFHEPAMRIKVPALKRLAGTLPRAKVPAKRIANFEKLSYSPEILDFARREQDRIWCWAITARSAASMFTYEPPLDWSAVQTPVLVLVGEGDEMVTPAFHEAVVAAGRPRNVDLRVLTGLGHLLFHDHLAEMLPLVTGWIEHTLEHIGAPAPAGA
jgi:nucleoside-diphosphate-sugar epimerase/pimeloyl-ACP methyl ester carboxylesterase